MSANPYFALRLSSAAASAPASHEASFKISSGELEASRVQIVYPSAFVFHGFTALGSANTQVGSLGVQLDAVGITPSGATPVRSLDDESAYADADSDGVYTPGVDPLIEHARFPSEQTLTIYLPLGGDFSAATTTVPGNLQMSAFLAQGLFTNPVPAGSYTVSANLTSVDPDNDGIDDGVAPAPQRFETQLSFVIGGNDLCSTGPSSRCLKARASSLKIQKGTTDDKDKITWSWSKGDLFLQGAASVPSDYAEYAVCLYDSTDGIATPRMALTVDPGALWLNNNPKGWKYKDKAGTSDGATKISFKPGIAGKSKVQFAGKGANLPMPAAVGGGKFFAQEPNVIVQLVNSKGNCWSSEFTAATKNEPTKFQAKAKAP